MSLTIQFQPLSIILILGDIRFPHKKVNLVRAVFKMQQIVENCIIWDSLIVSHDFKLISLFFKNGILIFGSLLQSHLIVQKSWLAAGMWLLNISQQLIQPVFFQQEGQKVSQTTWL